MPRAKTLVSYEYARPPQDKVIESNKWFIGIDQSSTYNGIAVYNTDTNHIYTTNFFCGKNDVELIDRLYRLVTYVEKLVTEIRPKFFYTEEIHPGNRHAYAVLLRVETLLHSMLYRNYIMYDSISANVKHSSSWPSLLKIKGSKEHIKLALSGMTDPLSTEHELDAIGVLIGSMVRDGYFKLELFRSLKINRIANCNEFIEQLRQLSCKES